VQVVGVVGIWAVALPVVVALGLPVGLLAGRRGPQVIRAALWSGLAIAAAVVLLVHTWLPLRSGAAVAVLLALALAALAAGLAGGRRRLVVGWTRPPWWVLAPAASVVVLLAIGSSLTPTHYDFGLYHFGAVRFAAEHPAVPGLANLLPYYGYSTPEFPLAGLLTAAGDDGFRALNGLFAIALVADLVLRLAGRSRAAGTSAAAVLVVVGLTPLLVFADVLLASPTSDAPVLVLTLASTAALADALGRRRVARVDLVVALAPLLPATAMRPQMAIVLVATAAVIAILVTRQGRWRAARPPLAGLGAVAVLLAAATAVRDYVLSGWLVYPLSILPLPVEWRADDPDWLRAITVGIARDPGPGYQEAATGYAWLPGWLGRLPGAWETWAVAGLLLACVVVALATRHRPVRWRRLALLVLPGTLFLLAWVVALPPTWRLAWGAALGVPAAALGWLLHRAGIRPGRLAAGALIALLVVGLGSAVLRYPAKPDRLPDVTTAPFLTDGGLTLIVPQGTDQCWASPLLCTSVPDVRLTPLGPAIEDGFTVGN
jgi:hypothetical protein